MLSDKPYLKGIENGKYARGTGLVANFIGIYPIAKIKNGARFRHRLVFSQLIAASATR